MERQTGHHNAATILRHLRAAGEKRQRFQHWRDGAILLSILLSAPLLLLLLDGLNPLPPVLKTAIWLLGLAATLYLAIRATRRHLETRRQSPEERLLQIARTATEHGPHPHLLDGVDLALQREHLRAPTAEKKTGTHPDDPPHPTGPGGDPDTSMLDHAIGQIFREIDPQTLRETLDEELRHQRSRSHTLSFTAFALLAATLLTTSALLAPERTGRALAMTGTPQPSEPVPAPPRPIPELTRLQAILIPPAYTGWTADTLELSPSAANPQTIDTNQPILPGTTLVLSGRSDQIGALTLHSSDDSTLRAEHPVSATFPFRATRTLEQSDTLALRPNNSNPLRIVTPLSPDRPPVVQWIEPATHLEADPGLKALPLRYNAHDHIGLASLTLEWELHRAFVPEPVSGTTPLPPPGPDQLEATHTWDLTDLDLRPRDELRFRITARDANTVTGPGTTRTPERLLRIPSMIDVLARLTRQTHSADEQLLGLQSGSETLRQRTEQLQNQLRTRGDAGPQEHEQLRQTESAANELESTLETARRDLQALEQQLDETPAISEETREAARQVANMMDELDHPALQEALRELREAMQEGGMNDLSSALRELARNEEQLRSRLGRTLQLFQDLKTNLHLDRLAARLDESADLLSPESAESGDPPRVEPATPDEPSGRDREALDGIGQVMDELPALGESAPERRQERLQELTRAVGRELRETHATLSRKLNGTEPVQPTTRNREATRIREQSERLRRAKTDMQSGQIQISLDGLERSLVWTLLLSDQQELLATRAPDLRQGHEAFASLARTQQRIRQQTGQLERELATLTEPIPPLALELDRLLEQARRALSAALTTLAERNPVQAEPATRTALASLNQLADLQQEAIRQLENQAGGGGLSMEQLADQIMNLSGEQLEINRTLQELINEEQGERLTMDKQERLDQLAREQNRVREELERLRRDAPQDERQSELEQTLREMEEAIRRLREGRPESVPDQQAEIHARMLRTQESLRQQGDPDETQARDAQRAEPTVRPLTDAEIESPERTWESELRLRLADPRQTPFAPEVQELMEHYIDRLRELE